MKFSTSAWSIFLLLATSSGSAWSHPSEDEPSSKLTTSYLRNTQDNENSKGKNTHRFLVSPGAAHGKGQVLARGNFGKIDTSSIPAAQAGAKAVLETLGRGGSNNKFVARNSNANHVRFTQVIHGMEVEGAALMVHADGEGNVVGINGELVDDSALPSDGKPTIDASIAIQAALDESRVPPEVHDECTKPTLTVVRGLTDGVAYLAWTCTVRYDMEDENGKLTPFNDQIFARAVGDDPGLIQIHPKIYGARSVETRNCKTTTRCSTVVSSSPDKISTSDLAINDAHNYAIDTYNYYFSKFSRDSINGAGMKIISRVHYSKNYVNAFWDGSQMTYGDGDNVQSIPLSRDRDVVAHELTHGVTERSSGLVYSSESGALNEALSDIFGALVEKANGESDDPSNGHQNQKVWKIGEDIWTPNTAGDALRYMYDPQRGGDYDWYPTRYTGTSDNGGIHWNSGIANLAVYLMVNGGSHPRGKSAITVTPLGDHVARSQAAYDALGNIMYNSNTACLTPSSTFAMMRYCSAEIFGGLDKDNVHAAWDAVGVPAYVPPPPPTTLTDNVPVTGLSGSLGNVQDFTFDIAAGKAAKCTTAGNNGDADLYVRFGALAIPGSSANACQGISSNSNESCTTSTVLSLTKVYVAIHAYSSYSALTLTCGPV